MAGTAMSRRASYMYRYINDETLRLINKGYTMVEIAEQFKLPKAIASKFSNRGYYGSVNHNVKATYVLYLGWFTAIRPSSLNCHRKKVANIMSR
jgi:alkyl sulfatase BDS1-like metallo-beta-lactamase superfamily hydrolase